MAAEISVDRGICVGPEGGRPTRIITLFRQRPEQSTTHCGNITPNNTCGLSSGDLLCPRVNAETTVSAKPALLQRETEAGPLELNLDTNEVTSPLSDKVEALSLAETALLTTLMLRQGTEPVQAEALAEISDISFSSFNPTLQKTRKKLRDTVGRDRGRPIIQTIHGEKSYLLSESSE
ncbi:MAG: hypothetical protein AAB553_06845 [Patescibacteria group bacterium]